VQPRIRLCRSFDECSHVYQGYTLYLQETMNGEMGEFSVGIGKAAQRKHEFRIGDEVSGKCLPVPVPKHESVDYYRASHLRKLDKQEIDHENEAPPWRTLTPTLEVYRDRGHRRLEKRTYETRCRSCIWGARMTVEIIVDHWKPNIKRYRYEIFCYGPKSCPLHRPGPLRKVPGRNGMSWTEEDWIEQGQLSHRGPDD